MRNLCVLQHRQARLGEGAGGCALQLCACSAEGLVYVITDRATVLAVSADSLQPAWQALLPGAAPPGAPLEVALFTWVMELEALSIGLATGELLLLHTGSREVEEVGVVSEGLAAAEWSPDGELLVAVSRAGRLLVMNTDWQLLAEVMLDGDDTASAPAGTYADVCITWRGDGKYFATSSQRADGSGDRHILVWDREDCQLHAEGDAASGLGSAISWQPNGRHLYAVQAMHPEQLQQLQELAERHPRYLMTYSKQPPSAKAATGQLQAPAAAAAGSPDGGRRGLIHRVLLHERNGLQHGGFIVPTAACGQVHDLSWSSDSELLAVVLGPVPGLEATTAEDEQPWAVQVWHRSNWHWYLKQEFSFAAAGAAGVQACWDDQLPMQLHMLCANGSYNTVTFLWDTCVSARGTTLVADGHRLLITPLRQSLVPPPMAAVSATCSRAIVCIAITEDEVGELAAALLSDGRLALLRCVEDDLWEETLQEQEAGGGSAGTLQAYEPAFTAPLPSGGQAKALLWLAPGKLLLVTAPSVAGEEGGRGDVLTEVSVTLPDRPGPPAAAAVLFTSYASGSVYRAVTEYAAAVPASNGAAASMAAAVLLQLTSGSVLRYSPGQQLQVLNTAAAFPKPCCYMWALPPASALQLGGAAPALGLAASGDLYWGSRLLAHGVTSASLRDDGPGGAALLYTTRQDLLYTVLIQQLQTYKHQQAELSMERHVSAKEYKGELREAMSAAMRPAGASLAVNMAMRAVEQGARLVAAPSGDVTAILQMPRGNLEGVAPRLLVLVAAALALRQGQYQEAWRLVTVHRVDLNLLVDLDWPAFLDHAPAFVQVVADADSLCSILMALKPHSVLEPAKGLYAALVNYLPAPKQPLVTAAASNPAAASADVSNKVTAVCMAIRDAVLSQHNTTNASAVMDSLKVVVTSSARSDPPDLEAAMMAIKQAKESAASSHDPASADAAADAAMRHLLLYTDADALYAVALGMYDLSLAFMVVSQAQKDPGEYLGELQQFAAVQDVNLQRYAIDAHLRRWELALHNLVAAGAQHFDAAVALAKQHDLLRPLLALCNSDEQRGTVLIVYAEKLLERRRFEDAAVAFMAAGQPERALDAYRSAGKWRMAMVLAGRLQWSVDRQQALAAELAEQLSIGGQGSEAAQLLVQYLKDIDGAVLHLIQAKEWRQALQMSYAHNRPDLVDTLVIPAAAAAAALLMDDAKESTTKLAKYLARIKDVRARRQAMATALAASEGRDADAAADDLISEAPSVVSGFSMYTDRTGATTMSNLSSVSSVNSASTIGGRPALRSKKAKKATRIKQGSASEEVSLIKHVFSLAPAAHVLCEAGQLTELLCMLSNFADASTLQQQLAAWQAAALAAKSDIDQHPPSAAPGQPSLVEAAGDGSTSAVEWKWDVLRGAVQAS